MTRTLKFTTLDVFTSTRFSGNPLAIIHVPHGTTLSHTTKLSIAAEFNLSESVFLHEPASESTPETAVNINIFTPTLELPFAGHPTIGTGFHLLSRTTSSSSTTLITGTGLHLRVRHDPSTQKTRASIAHDAKIHPGLDLSAYKSQQQHLTGSDYVAGLSGAERACSIVKGMTFVMIRLSGLGALGRLQVVGDGVGLPVGWLGEWEGLVGVYSYVLLDEEEDGVVRVQTRMFLDLLEDPATGSAACALACFLALTMDGPRVRVFEVVQGVEMGRRSEIGVRVVLKEGGGEVEEVELSGTAVKVMEGVLSY